MRNRKEKVTSIRALILLCLGSFLTLIWSMTYLVDNNLISLLDLFKSIISVLPVLIPLASHQQNEMVMYQGVPTSISVVVLLVFIVSLIVFIPTVCLLYKRVRDHIQRKK